MREEALKNIKRHYLSDFIKALFGFILFFTFIIFIVCLMFNAEEITFFSSIFAILFIFGIGFIDFIFLKLVFENLNYFLHPFKSNVFATYGDIDKVLDEISSTIEYKDYRMIISKRYIISTNDYRNLCLFDNVIRVYIKEYKVNFVTERYELILIDKCNSDNICFTFDRTEKEKVENVLKVLMNKCLNAQFG